MIGNAGVLFRSREDTADDDAAAASRPRSRSTKCKVSEDPGLRCRYSMARISTQVQHKSTLERHQRLDLTNNTEATSMVLLALDEYPASSHATSVRGRPW